MQCKITEPAMATSKNGLAKIPISKREASSDKALTALNISIITKTVKDKVEAFYFPQVKYKQGSSSNLYSKKFLIVKPYQSLHSVKFLSYSKEINWWLYSDQS